MCIIYSFLKVYYFGGFDQNLFIFTIIVLLNLKIVIFILKSIRFFNFKLCFISCCVITYKYIISVVFIKIY